MVPPLQCGHSCAHQKVTNMLVERGKVLPALDRMYLARGHVLFVVPVGAGSKLAELIQQPTKTNQSLRIFQYRGQMAADPR